MTRLKKLSAAAVGVLMMTATFTAVLPVLPASANGLIQFVGATAVASGSTSNLSLAKPAEAVTGDLLIAEVNIENGTTQLGTTPAGWNVIASVDQSSNVGMRTYWRFVASDSEDPWTFLTGGKKRSGGIAAYRGVDPNTPIDASTTNPGTDSSNTTMTANEVSTTRANAMLLALFGTKNNVTHGLPASMTQRINAAASDGFTSSLNDHIVAAAGLSGTRTSTAGGSTGGWISQTIALRPEDVTPPTAAVTHPAHEASLNVATYRAGCADNAADLCGTASDNAAVSQVHVSVGDEAGMYWDGDGFDAAEEQWLLASGTTSWTLAFPTANLPADGDYTIRARATDASANTGFSAAHTFTIDVTIPTTTIDAAPDLATQETDADFAFSSDAPDLDGFECKLDDEDYEECDDGAASYPGPLAEDEHTFLVRATDAAGNTEDPAAEHAWTIDLTRPSVSIARADGQDDPTNDDEIELDVLFDEPVTGFEASDVSLLGSPAGSTPQVAGSDDAYTVTVSGMTADGTVTAAVIDEAAADAAGNLSEASPTAATVIYDATLPQTDIDFPLDAPYNGAGWAAGCLAAGFCGGSTDALSGVAEVNLSLLQEDSGKYWNAATGDFDLDDEGDAMFEAPGVEDAGVYEWAYGFAFGDFPVDGDYTLTARATDAAGNEESTDTATFTIDGTRPEVEIAKADGQGDPTNADQIELDVTFDEDVTGFDGADIALGGTAGATTATVAGSGSAYTVTVSGMTTDGTVTASVTDEAAEDAAGNLSNPSPTGVELDYDITAPSGTVDLTTTPDALSNDDSPVFEFSTTDGDIASFQCRLDEVGIAAFAACESGDAFPGLADGPHSFEVRGLDAAGNAGPAARYDWAIDATDPAAAITFPADGEIYAQAGWDRGCAAPGLCGTAADPGGSGVATVEIALMQIGTEMYLDPVAGTFTLEEETFFEPGGTPTAWSHPFEWEPLHEVGYRLTARATDAAGNTESTAVVDFSSEVPIFDAGGRPYPEACDNPTHIEVGDEEVEGTSQKDVILALGANTVRGKGGKDIICTGDADHTIITGNGAVTIFDLGGTNTITTGDGKDTVTTSAGRDVIRTKAGADVIKAGNGNNRVLAGSGNDRIKTGKNNDYIHGGSGRDVCRPGGGSNTVLSC